MNTQQKPIKRLRTNIITYLIIFKFTPTKTLFYIDLLLRSYLFGKIAYKKRGSQEIKFLENSQINDLLAAEENNVFFGLKKKHGCLVVIFAS